jgi:hypothetical protein
VRKRGSSHAQSLSFKREVVSALFEEGGKTSDHNRVKLDAPTPRGIKRVVLPRRCNTRQPQRVAVIAGVIRGHLASRCGTLNSAELSI